MGKAATNVAKRVITVDEGVIVLKEVAGHDLYNAKTIIYYSFATHRQQVYKKFPILIVCGPPGSGKTSTLSVMKSLCHKPHSIPCHPTMSSAVLRDELAKAKLGTAFIEEGDLYPNRKQLQGYLINRYDCNSTSTLPVEEQYQGSDGVTHWATISKSAYGATVMHDRNLLDDLAAERRAIVVNTRFQQGTFKEPPIDIELPKLPALNPAPDNFPRGSAFDTWRPLLEVANTLGDSDWLDYALLKVNEATGELLDGHLYEEKLRILGAVIECYCEMNGMLLVKEPLPLKKIVSALRHEMPNLHPKTVSKTLRKMHFDVHNQSGTFKLFTTTEEIRKIAKVEGYKDDII